MSGLGTARHVCDGSYYFTRVIRQPATTFLTCHGPQPSAPKPEATLPGVSVLRHGPGPFP